MEQHFINVKEDYVFMLLEAERCLVQNASAQVLYSLIQPDKLTAQMAHNACVIMIEKACYLSETLFLFQEQFTNICLCPAYFRSGLEKLEINMRISTKLLSCPIAFKAH